MPLPYHLNKKHIDNWRVQNRNKSNEIDKMSKRRCRGWKSIQTIFLNILLS